MNASDHPSGSPDEQTTGPSSTAKSTKCIAVSEGEILVLEGMPQESPQVLTLQQRFNLMQSLQTDEAGVNLRDAPNFPDGHMNSPFRVRVWTIYTEEEYAQRPPPTAEQLAEWERLRLDDEERMRLYADNSAKWFETMGRYVTGFESMIGAVVVLTRTLLKKNGVATTVVKDIPDSR
jgi:hypothetical protein